MLRHQKMLLCCCAISLCVLTGCKSSDYKNATELYNNGEYTQAAELFTQLGDYKNSADFLPACTYGEASELYKESKFTEASELFASLGDYEDSAEMVTACTYGEASELYKEDKFTEASELFTSLGDYEDSAEMVTACTYGEANALYADGDYQAAKTAFETIADYNDSAELINACDYGLAQELYDEGSFDLAEAAFTALGDYEDSADMVPACSYGKAKALFDSGEYEQAADIFKTITDYEDSDACVTDCVLNQADAMIAEEDYTGAAELCQKEYERSGATEAADKMCACADGLLDDYTADDYANWDAASDIMGTIGDYEDYTAPDSTKNHFLFCGAERFFGLGALNYAMSAYCMLPDDYECDGIKAADRIAFLNKHLDFLKICGEWGKTGESPISIKRTLSTGAWDSWDFDDVSGEYSMIVLCIPESDGTFTINISGNYAYAKNYSDYASNVTIVEGETGAIYNGTSVPSSFASIDGYTTITYNGSALVVKYVIEQDVSTFSTLRASGTFTYGDYSAK